MIAAILLAAGQSSRMGAFKPLLPFGDSTVIETCVATLRAAGIETLIVVVGHRGEEIRKQLAGSSVFFADNPDPASEMGQSIALGARKIPPTAKAILIMPGDHPAVSGKVITELIEEWRSGSRLVIPTYLGRGGHPVVVDSVFQPKLLKLDPRRGLKGLFEDHPEAVKRLPVESGYIARDMDTWDDYLALHLDFFGFPPNIAAPQLENGGARQPN